MGIKFRQIESFFSGEIITNDALVSDLGSWSAEKIERKIGVRQRYVVTENQTSLSLGLSAAKLIKNIDNVDLIIFCTQSPDFFLPSSSCIIQNLLGVRTESMCFDINQGCSGYIYGLSLAKSLLMGKFASNCLFITADTYSKYISPEDLGNKALFGDGASATLLVYDNDEYSNIGEFIFGTDGSGYENLIVKEGATRDSFSRKPSLYMNGPAIYDFVINRIPSLVGQILEKNLLSIDDIDYFVFHQANKYILDVLREKLKLDKERFIVDLLDTGNTTSSSIPIILEKLLKNEFGKFQGKKIMCLGFGVGYSWGGTVLTL